MASTTFQQFNPTVSNQESDAQYTSDSLRSGGIQVDNILPSPLLNKAFYQWSTFIAAFCQMMTAKGYSTSDASVSALASVLSAIVTDADLTNGFLVVAYAPAASFNAASVSAWKMVLNGNVTSASISGARPGQVLTFSWQQDNTGGRTITYPANFGGWAQIDGTPNATTIQSFIVEDDMTYHAITPAIAS